MCVDEVAASGGYLMACVADHIVASPFAMLGSIGVISTMPNFYERLKREGVEVSEIVNWSGISRNMVYVDVWSRWRM